MNLPSFVRILQSSFLLFLSISPWSPRPQLQKDFVDCLLKNSDDPAAYSRVIYTPQKSSFLTVLNNFVRNLRFNTTDTPKPQVIITPVNESQIQTAILCSKKHGLQIRIRSGGHDFEGSSYVSEVPFFVLDMFNFRSISINAKRRTAWVGAGASLGLLYYTIDQINSSLAFPGGYCPTVGAGGHISGGGYGVLVRKHGLAADNVIDARVIDANGRILDRKSMGEELFWAIRGGVGASFCVILSYKVKLFEVPEKITAFRVSRTLEQNATALVYKWQSVAPRLPKDLIISLSTVSVYSEQTKNRTVQATFISAFQGDVDDLLQILQEHFPELGVSKQDCVTMRWVQYYPFHVGHPIDDIAEFLASGVPASPINFFKAKADFIQKPIPVKGLEEMWNMYLQIDAGAALMEWTPFGGRNDEIPESAIPYPHRAGNSIFIYEGVSWDETTTYLEDELLSWLNKFYSIVGKYVAKDPRRAFADYRDHDLGVNDMNHPTVEQAKVWGAPYFKGNFERLVRVKTLVDPENFFNYEQSIPPLTSIPTLASS